MRGLRSIISRWSWRKSITTWRVMVEGKGVIEVNVCRVIFGGDADDDEDEGVRLWREA